MLASFIPPRTGLISRFAILMLLLCGAALAAEAPCEPAPPETPNVTIAVSLRRYEAELEACYRTGCPADVLTWHGMRKVYGYVIDPSSHDIVLFGTTTGGATLRVDDYAVAVRSVTNRYAQRQRRQSGDVLVVENPGVTIDPDANVLARLDAALVQGPASVSEKRLKQYCEICELPQTVHLFGLGRDSQSNFGNVMFSGDFLMKRIANGTLAVEGLESLDGTSLRLAIVHAQDDTRGDRAVVGLNRFWFVSGRTEYQRDATTTLLARADVGLLTEAETVEAGSVKGMGRTNPLAARFACEFSKSYPALASAGGQLTVYAELESLYRWVALLRLMADDSVDLGGFARDRLVVHPVDVPRMVKGVANIGRWDYETEDGATRTTIKLRLGSCGGIDMGVDVASMTVLPDEDRVLPRLFEDIGESRPSPMSVWWEVRR